MKLLITGGTGFISSAVICHIIDNANHSVVNVNVDIEFHIVGGLEGYN